MDERWLITRTGTLVEAGVDDEMFGLDIEGGHCFGFNSTASEIWQLLEQPHSLGALCDALLVTRDVDRPTCLADTAALVQALAEEKLVALTPP